MKKWTLFLSLYLCLGLLASCTGSSSDIVPEELPADGTTDTSMSIEDGPPWFLTCRIVSGAKTGNLVLAEHGEDGRGVYTLSFGSLPDDILPEEPLRDGQLVNVYYESFTEAWPMDFGGVSAVEIVEGGFDDRACLYLTVLEDLWEVDPALSENITYMGIDLSETSLSPAERAAVGWVFAGRHKAELVEGTLDDLMKQGYITGEPLGTEDAPSDAKFWHWEDGCFFSITEQPMEGTYSLVPVTFDAQKWRSSLGAYWFSDCTALQSALGEWSDYQIGSEMIS